MRNVVEDHASKAMPRLRGHLSIYVAREDSHRSTSVPVLRAVSQTYCLRHWQRINDLNTYNTRIIQKITDRHGVALWGAGLRCNCDCGHDFCLMIDVNPLLIIPKSFKNIPLGTGEASHAGLWWAWVWRIAARLTWCKIWTWTIILRVHKIGTAD